MKKMVIVFVLMLSMIFSIGISVCAYGEHNTIVPPNKPCQKSRSIFSVVRIEKGTDLVRI